MTKELQEGYVYILTNPSFKEDWVKIGKSSRPVDVRSKELDNTAVPLPFEIYATMKTTKFAEVERIIHKQIDRLTDLRIRQNREFFNVHPAQALDIFRDIAMAVDDAEIIEYENNLPINPETDIIDKTIKSAFSDTSEIQLRFWEEFNTQAVNHETFFKEFSVRKAYPQHWYDLSIGSSEYHICLTASRQKHELTAGLYISDNKELYYHLRNHTEELEQAIGDKIKWKEASKASRFLICRPFDIDDKTQWSDAVRWLYDKSVTIKGIMKNLGGKKDIQ